MNEFWPVGCGGSSAPLNPVGSLIRQSFDHCIETLCQRYRVPSENIRVAFARHYRYIPLENQVLFPGVREACQSVLELGGMNTIVTHRSVVSSRALLDPARVLEALRRHRLKADETPMVGDRELGHPDRAGGGTAYLPLWPGAIA